MAISLPCGAGGPSPSRPLEGRDFIGSGWPAGGGQGTPTGLHGLSHSPRTPVLRMARPPCGLARASSEGRTLGRVRRGGAAPSSRGRRAQPVMHRGQGWRGCRLPGSTPSRDPSGKNLTLGTLVKWRERTFSVPSAGESGHQHGADASVCTFDPGRFICHPIVC